MKIKKESYVIMYIIIYRYYSFILLLLIKNVHKLLLRRSNPVLDRYGSIPLGETSHRYPSPPLMGPALQCRVADLAARMAYTTLVSNPGDLDWHAE